jgi:hypothetical protein
MKKVLGLFTATLALSLALAGLANTNTAQACDFGPASARSSSGWPAIASSTVSSGGRNYTLQSWVQNTDGGFRWLWSGALRGDGNCSASGVHGANYTSEFSYSTGKSTVVTNPLTSTQCGVPYWRAAPAGKAINNTQIQVWKC